MYDQIYLVHKCIDVIVYEIHKILICHSLFLFFERYLLLMSFQSPSFRVYLKIPSIDLHAQQNILDIFYQSHHNVLLHLDFVSDKFSLMHGQV